MTDEELELAVKRREPAIVAIAWVGALDDDELHWLARGLTTPDLLLEVGDDLDELRALLPDDVSALEWADVTEPLALDVEAVTLRSPDASIIAVTMSHEAGDWQVQAINVQGATQ